MEQEKKKSLTQDMSEYWVQQLGLIKHPEGGYFKEIYRSDDQQQDNGKQRSTLTTIYFLLDKQSPISQFHWVDTTEQFIYIHGAPMEIVKIMEDGSLKTEILGSDLHKGQQAVNRIHPCKFFGARTLGEFTVIACACTPGFQYEGFRLIPYKELMELYPQHKEQIEVYGYKN